MSQSGLALGSEHGGQDYATPLADKSAVQDYDIDAARTHGFGFARIQRHAIEHLLGVR